IQRVQTRYRPEQRDDEPGGIRTRAKISHRFLEPPRSSVLGYTQRRPATGTLTAQRIWVLSRALRQNHLDLYRGTKWELSHTQCRASMPTVVPKNFPHQSRRAVYHEMLISECGIRVHISGDANDSSDVIERTNGFANSAQHVCST